MIAKVGEPITLPLADGLSVRLYSDSRPSNLEIGGLHKGLILLADGEELVEEGAGLGVPVARYRDKTYFPGSSHVSVLCADPPKIRKTFDLNMVSKKYIGGVRISDTIYRPLHGAFHMAYVSAPSLRSIFDRVMRFREDAGVKTSFERVSHPRGNVSVTYTARPTGIAVDIDLSGLMVESLVQVTILNEQGARFSTYSDSDGLMLRGKEIGGWNTVHAEECTLTDSSSGTSYTLRATGSATLLRGREAVRGRFSWAGLNYTLDREVRKLGYVIYLRRDSSHNATRNSILPPQFASFPM